MVCLYHFPVPLSSLFIRRPEALKKYSLALFNSDFIMLNILLQTCMISCQRRAMADFLSNLLDYRPDLLTLELCVNPVHQRMKVQMELPADLPQQEVGCRSWRPSKKENWVFTVLEMD
ncbi:hypothetical protein AABB24_003790 [Solanum stoloniferum]|uniref:Uncharacterized protein n=1 Tax=Solanum stoloniferum TaxID=62892 RepID=A0ABD2V8T4_9SOLN